MKKLFIFFIGVYIGYQYHSEVSKIILYVYSAIKDFITSTIFSSGISKL